MSVRMFLVAGISFGWTVAASAADETKPMPDVASPPAVKAQAAPGGNTTDTKSAACREPGPCGVCDCPDDGPGNDTSNSSNTGNTTTPKPETPKSADP